MKRWRHSEHSASNAAIGWLRRLICLVGVIVLPESGARAFEGYSDPLSPSQADEISAAFKVSIFQISERLKQVEKEIEQEKMAIQALAPLQASKQFDAFGYHSDYIPLVEGIPEEPLWTLEFNAGMYPTLGFVMVPALDQRSSDLKGYAFPKRFRICSVDERGRRKKVYVDWIAQDFPDPGLRPVYFGFPPEDAPIEPLRVEVFAGHQENGLEFFALGRIHLIRQDEQQRVKGMTVSSSFDSAPYWDSAYLASARYTLGMPLSARKGSGGNLVLNMPDATLKKPLVIRVDLDETVILGWINLFPGQSPVGINVPGYGFPQTINIYGVSQANPKSRTQRFLLMGQDALKNPGNNMIRLAGGGKAINALEIECNDFPVYQEQAVFSLGEIEVIKGGNNLSKNRRVTIRGITPEKDIDWGALVDGTVGGRDILPLPIWLQQLAEGKPHKARLKRLEAEQQWLTEQWQQIRVRGRIGVGLLAFSGVSGFILIMLRSRKLAQIQLRRKVSCDLHDDVGSSLGSISLIAEYLQHADVNEEVREDLCDLSLIAREAWASLREVVWVIDEKSIRLPALIQKLIDRAQRVLIGVNVSIEIPEACPDYAVSLTFKRHLIMFFKEVVHNCARHARATQVWMRVEIANKYLLLSVRDNGCGFNLTEHTAGLGLDSIRNRAQEMGGELRLNSKPGKGTQVVLSVPLKALSNKSDHSYKTSN